MTTLYERTDSRELTADRNGYGETLRYWCEGTSDQNAVWLATLDQSPTVWDSLVRQSIRIVPDGRPDLWSIEVDYGPIGQDGTADAVGATPADPSTPAGGKPAGENDALGAGYSVEIGTETIHITQALRHIAHLEASGSETSGSNASLGVGNVVSSSGALSEHLGNTLWITSTDGGWLPGGYLITSVSNGVSWTVDRAPGLVGSSNGNWIIRAPGPDHKGVIGVDDGEIRGVDRLAPKTEWSRTVSLAVVSTATIKLWRSLVGKVNASAFYHYDAGEVLYLGASGSYSNQERWRVTHRFAVQENQFNLEISGGLVIPVKRGWEYVWVQYVPKVVSGKMVRRAAAAYLEEIYPPGDFNLLGIGE